MTYLLDANVVSYFLQVRREHDLAAVANTRLIALPSFLRRLVDAHALSAEAAVDVMRQSNQVVPTWWPDWRAGS